MTLNWPGDDAVMFSGGFDRRAIAWVRSASDPYNWERAGFVGDYGRGITTCCLSSDGMVAITGGWSQSLRLHPLEDVRLHAALAGQDGPAPLALVAPTSAQGPVDTLLHSQQGDSSPTPAGGAGLPDLLADVVPDLDAKYPGILQAVADVEKMVGVHRAKVWIRYMTRFLAQHAGPLGFRNRQFNALLLGQQGTGKLHFAKLFARYLIAAGLISAPSSLAPAIASSTSATSAGTGGDEGLGGIASESTTSASASVSSTVSGASFTEDESKASSSEDTWPLVVLRIPKLKTRSTDALSLSTVGAGGVDASDQSPGPHAQTANPHTSAAGANLLKFLEKHKGQVVLIKDIEIASPDLLKTVAQVLQKFLRDRPGVLAILISARNRGEVFKLLSHYQPARPETVRAHFPYIIEFDRYSGHQLMTIFRRQCDSEQVRLSTSATELMLERAFALNFNFFDGTNGAGTRHLLKLAKTEHSRRGGSGGQGAGRSKKEGLLLESTDIQAAFQRLRYAKGVTL